MAKKISYLKSAFEVLVQPQITMQNLIERDPGYGKWVIIPIYGFLSAFNPIAFVIFSRFFEPWVAFLLGVVLIMAIEVFSFWITAFLNFLFGKLLGGKGTFGEVSTANAWAYVPCFPMLVVQGLFEMPRWSLILQGETDLKTVLETGKLLAHLGLLVSLPFLIWSLVLVVIGLSEAHAISIGKAIGVIAINIGLWILLTLGIIIYFFLSFHR